jgi:hypothetical protein
MTELGTSAFRQKLLDPGSSIFLTFTMLKSFEKRVGREFIKDSAMRDLYELC